MFLEMFVEDTGEGTYLLKGNSKYKGTVGNRSVNKDGSYRKGGTKAMFNKADKGKPNKSVKFDQKKADAESKRRQKAREREEKVKELLDNAGQGFLYFNNDMKIGAEYSSEVIRLLGSDLANRDITELLYPKYKEDRLEFAENLKYILLGDDEDTQDILISLLPQEFKINERYIKFEYKVLKKQMFMLILTDITREKELSKEVEYKHKVLKMVVETVTTMEQFLELKNDYENFITKIDEYKDIDRLTSLARDIHTFKGLFAQKEMLHVVEELHNFENYIVSSRKENKLDDVIKNITQEVMYSWIKKDIEILEDVLGDDIFNKSRNVSIDILRIDNLHKKVERLYGHIKNNINSQEKKELKEISKNIDTFSYHSVNIFLDPYIKLVEQLSIRLEKQINPLIIESGDIFLGDEYKRFLNSLVHIFRNSVDHGIESVEDRFEQNKPDFGTIKCKVKKDDEFLYIEISDDGKGIDKEIIKKLAMDKNIYTEQDVLKLNEQEILKIIFLDSFSTNEVVTDVSGRGVGLASILEELKVLNGEIDIENKKGFGVKFKFKIPVNQI